jgi:anti-sigma factor RsiW
MNRPMSGRRDGMMTCREMVELVTDYLEGRMDDATRERFEAHVSVCDACTVYIEQMRQTIVALGHIPAETISPEAEEELLAAFRTWRDQTV